MADGTDSAFVVNGATELSDQRCGPQLRRTLGQRDLIFLIVVAVVNLNTVPVIASGGPVTVWMWALALLLFFLPQGLAVIELSQRYPHEGGVYLWTKATFGDFHGFMSGWCYWTNNMFGIPILVLAVVGISVFIGGPALQALGDDKTYVLIAAVLTLWLMTGINVLGLNVGKWVTNVGGIGSVLTTLGLVGLALAVSWTRGLSLRGSDFRVSTFDWRFIGAFSVVCYACIGLELASAMGDEIKDPARSLPRAVALGGVVAGSLYVMATLAVLLAMPAHEIGAVQGVLQALGRMAGTMGIAWIVPPIAVLLSLAFAGTTSAWLGGAARIPFVAGIDNYLPPALGTLHPRYATPHIALFIQGIVSCIVLVMGFLGSTVQEAYRVLLLLAVVLQLIPFAYVFAALIKLASSGDFQRVRYSRATLLATGMVGFIVTAVGFCLAFVPAGKGDSALMYETKMIVGTLFFLGLGTGVYYRSPRRRGLAHAMPSRSKAARHHAGPR